MGDLSADDTVPPLVAVMRMMGGLVYTCRLLGK